MGKNLGLFLSFNKLFENLRLLISSDLRANIYLSKSGKSIFQKDAHSKVLSFEYLPWKFHK